MNKYCPSCENDLPSTQFCQNKNLKSGLDSWCRQCKNKKDEIRRKTNRHKLIELAGSRCVDCLQVFPDVCYDFHHLDPTTKESAVSNMTRRYNLQKAIEEIKKCVLLCANCHRLRHEALFSEIKGQKLTEESA